MSGKHNLYTYCHNSPTNHSDPSGMGIGALIGLLGGMLLLLTGCSSTENNCNSESSTLPPPDSYNCYGYVMREYRNIRSGLSGVYTVEQMFEKVKQDYPGRIRRIDGPHSDIASNEYRACVRVGACWSTDPITNGPIFINEFHMMREDNGVWSHKPGNFDLEYLDKGVTPDDISWDYKIEYMYRGQEYEGIIEDFYDSKIIYFAVSYK